jgi:phage gp29-like protein
MFARACFEIVWDLGPDGRICPSRIAFRPLDNTQVVLDKHGQPSSLEQRFSGETIPIDADHSLIYLHNQHRAPGVGISDIGPVWQSHWRKKALVALWAIFLNRAAMPWTVAKSENAQDPKQIGSLARTVATIKSGGVVGLGQGESATTLDAGGQAGQVFLSALEWLDRQSTQSTLTQFLDLGQSKVGSFALSKDHSDLFAQGRDGVLKSISADFTKQVIVKALRAAWGERATGRMEFASLSQGNPDQLATLLQQLATAPTVNPAISAELVRQVQLGVAKNLGLDVQAIADSLNTTGSPDAQMASAVAGGVHVLRSALPVAA